MLNNSDFYPTPSNLAAKMAAMISPSLSKSLLEPSAGKGDLAEAIQNRNRYSATKVDCIESDPELCALLVGKGLNLIDNDFLAYQPSKQYDSIVMNPPFSAGAAHVLKAWDVLYNGDVIAIINAETLRNTCTKERVLLAGIVEQYGTVEYIANAFVSAERKTGVEIALIHLKKRNSINKDYFDGMAVASDEAIESEGLEGNAGNQIAIPTAKVANMVLAYNKAIEYKRKAIISSAEADYYTGLIMGKGKDETENVKNDFNAFIDKLRLTAWRDVINLADFQKYGTSKVKESIRSNSERACKLEFTENNINKFLKNLVLGYDRIVEDCLLDVFDRLTRYDKDNRVHIEGWKSNDYFFINKRVVIPRITKLGWGGEVQLEYTARDKIVDMERVLSHLSGKTEFVSLMDVAEKEKDLMGLKVESEFFTARFYKKGTAHFYFKDKKLLERFNLTVGRLRGWLPKTDERVPKEFWIMNK